MRTPFSHILIAITLVAGVICFYFFWEQHEDYAYGVAACLMMASIAWVFSPQLNWWWYQSRPPALEDPIVRLLETRHPFYRSLNKVGQHRFRERLALQRMSTDFSSMGQSDESIPADLQSAIAAQWVTVSWNSPKLLLPAYEKVILSPAGFLSPDHPVTHHSELHALDKCLILSAEAVMAAFMKPEAFFQVALYEYARVYDEMEGIPVEAHIDEALVWKGLEEVAGYSQAQIESVVGVPGLHWKAVAVHHFFQYKEAFKRVLPGLAQLLEDKYSVEIG